MKLLAGFIIATGAYRILIVTIATFIDMGTVADRASDRFDAIVIFALGAILWQITQLLRRQL